MLGENVYVASGAIVSGAVLGNAVEVHENAHIAEGVVVGDRSIIGRNAVVANNVKIYPFKSVEPGSTVRSSIVWETRGPSTLFGRNGVRGLVNVDVTPETAMRLAMSYGTLITKGTYVTTSRDTHQACRVFKTGHHQRPQLHRSECARPHHWRRWRSIASTSRAETRREEYTFS